jgi:outer membrane scaffolding protein for murein synthesis (MipA/OmpV family)
MRGLMAAGVAAAVLAPGVCMADEWIITIGARLSENPPWEGAGHDVLAPSPTFSLRRADSIYRFTPPDDGSSLSLLANRYIDVGPVIRFRYSRGDEGQLTGLNKVGWAAEPGVFVNLWPTNWLRGRVEARRGVIGDSGWVGDAGIDLIHTGSRWEGSIGPRVGYGDTSYMDSYFQVTPEEAARSPLINTAYNPEGGRRYTGAEAAIGYRLFGGLRVIGDFGYHRLSNTIADSPIVEVAGSRDQYSGGIGLTYTFGVGH